MSNGCEFFADPLVDRAAGRLDPYRTELLASHLEECPDCRDALRVIERVAAHPPRVPEGLEHRIRRAVRDARGSAPLTAGRTGGQRALSLGGWRGWAAPLAAAVALVALWIGVDRDSPPPDSPEAAAESYEPYGTWPAADGQVAGEPLLSELTVEELEDLLQEMES